MSVCQSDPSVVIRPSPSQEPNEAEETRVRPRHAIAQRIAPLPAAGPPSAYPNRTTVTSTCASRRVHAHEAPQSGVENGSMIWTKPSYSHGGANAPVRETTIFDRASPTLTAECTGYGPCRRPPVARVYVDNLVPPESAKSAPGRGWRLALFGGVPAESHSITTCATIHPALGLPRWRPRVHPFRPS